ncbi:MAG: hypothetical protein IJ304_01215 [Clostridia bacterium]|nr:hypothetical protein [Clostridia bacterium]
MNKRTGLYFKRTVGMIAFLLIFLCLFSFADRILSRKETEGWWNVTAKIDGFYNSPENEYDVMYFGSSNAYCSFNPLVVWEKTGVKSYVFATQQQPVWATYHYMVDALKTQDLDLAVVDVLMFSKNDEYYDDGVNYTFCDNMPLSKNKLELVKASAPSGERFSLACRFMKYHSRWNELKEADFAYNKREMSDYSKGFYVLPTCYDMAEAQDLSGVLEEAPLTEKNLDYLNKIIELCKKEGVELMLVKTPSNATPDEKKYYNTVEKVAKENGVTFVDYNMHYDEIGFDFATDFFDDSHLNVSGAEKFTEYFVENTEYFDGRKLNDSDWQAEWEEYIKATKE